MPKQTGFTLIELMVAMVIIGTLLTASTIGISKAQQHARNSQRIGDVALISKGIDQVSVQNAVYPEISDGSQGIIGSPVWNLSKIDLTVFQNGKIPADPKPVITYSNSVSPVTRRTNDLDKDILAGYFYSLNYAEASDDPAYDTNAAEKLETYYTIEVGLEDESVDDYQIKSSDELGISTTPKFKFKVSDSGKDRYRYILSGPPCGTSCPKL